MVGDLFSGGVESPLGVEESLSESDGAQVVLLGESLSDEEVGDGRMTVVEEVLPVEADNDDGDGGAWTGTAVQQTTQGPQ
jgi:hypothetical protein